MLKRKAINLLAILTALAMCLCVMIPTEASAAPVDYSSIPSSELPASLGGNLHGRKTESIDIEGKGTLQATADYENGTFQIIDFDGTVQEIPLQQAVEQMARQLEGMSEEQLQEMANLADTPQLSRSSNSTLCKVATDAAKLIQSGAISAALKLIGKHPILGAVIKLGNSAFFAWIKSHC